jgi:hypothetical protein
MTLGRCLVIAAELRIVLFSVTVINAKIHNLLSMKHSLLALLLRM